VETINQEYQKECFVRHNVMALPTMSQIQIDGTLSLTGYKLNPGICAALGDFLGKNTQLKNPYIVTNLILDDNGIAD